MFEKERVLELLNRINDSICLIQSQRDRIKSLKILYRIRLECSC